MRRILIAGASGYLGRHLVITAHRRGYRVRALARAESKLAPISSLIDEVVTGEATRPATLLGVAADVDSVVSAIGITRQREGFTYDDVDYGANANLLHEALRARVRRFAYVSVLSAEHMGHLRIVAAKERFVAALRASGIGHVVVRPNGYFSDMRAFLRMARRGRAYVFGDGPVEFVLAMLTRDMIGPARGRERLTDFFAREALRGSRR